MPILSLTQYEVENLLFAMNFIEDSVNLGGPQRESFIKITSKLHKLIHQKG